MKTTKEQLTQGLLVLRAVADSIRELKRVPSGVLYAQVMSLMDLPTYERIIETLKRTGLVAESNFMLEWRGPSIVEETKQNSLL